jgi:Kelch motif
MIDHLPRLSIVVLGVLTLAACGDDTPTQPAQPTQPTGVGPELAVASDTWITRADLPTNRTELATATVTNAAGQSVVYAMGGTIWELPYPGTPVAKVTAYNVVTNTWTTRQPLPKALASTNGAGVLNGKIYVTGGYSHGGIRWWWPTVFMYDPATNTWTRKRDMPKPNGQYPAGGGVTGVIGGTLYVVSDCFLKDSTGGDLSPGCNPLFLRYNPTTDQWVILPPPFSPAIHAGNPSIGGVIDGKFYVMASSYNATTGSNDAHFAVYDPATNKWTTRTPLAHGLYGAASAVLGRKLYVMGGSGTNDLGEQDVLDVNIAYDPMTDAWTRQASLPSPRYSISASKVFLNGKPRIELVGGMLSPGTNLQYVP